MSESRECPSIKPGTDIQCQRPEGHDGKHGRSMDEYSTVRWEDQ
jgi:hypothetical protein